MLEDKPYPGSWTKTTIGIVIIGFLLPSIFNIVAYPRILIENPVTWLLSVLMGGFFGGFPPYILAMIIIYTRPFLSTRRKEFKTAIFTGYIGAYIASIITTVEVLNSVFFGTRNSTAAIGILFIPFACIVPMSIGLLIGALVGFTASKIIKTQDGLTENTFNKLLEGKKGWVLGSLIFLGLILTAITMRIYYSQPEPGIKLGGQADHDLLRPGIQESKAAINSRQVVSADIGSRICSIQRLQTSNHAKGEIAVIGQFGVWFVSLDGYKLIKKYTTGDGAPSDGFGLEPILFDLDGKNKWQIAKGGGGYGDIGVFDLNGKERWVIKYAGNEFNAMVCFPGIQGKAAQFYALNNQGLYPIDVNGVVGKPLLQGHYWDLCKVTVGDKERLLALAFQDKAPLLIDPVSGSQMAMDKLTSRVIAACFKWKGQMCYLDGSVDLINQNGESILNYPIKNFPVYQKPQGTPIRFVASEEPYLAILVQGSSGIDTSLLNIFSPNAELVYQEVIPKTHGLLAVSQGASGREVLLVGKGNEGVLEYSMK